MNVIGLSAKIGCGKTTLAKMIADKWPGVVLRESFGNLLKQECSAHFGFPVGWCYSQEGKDHPVDFTVYPSGVVLRTVREALQWYGTDFRRRQDPCYWAKAMQEAIELGRAAHPGALIIIDDVRFPNEAELVLEHGSLFRIEPYDGWQPGPNAEHVSETALDGYARFSGVFRPTYGMTALALVADCIQGRVWA